MTVTTSDDSTAPGERIAGPKQLSKPQRRALGVLVEKAMTTPDQYPLTLKAATAGCNQKSNREPVTNYSEEQVERFLTELRTLGLVAVVHTESGRTERFRHYVRKAYPFNEPQIAIMAELWMRGRQQLGELRGRASRMAPIDTLEQLRAELQILLDQGFIQANGALERRGIEVDHNFYQPDEGRRLEPSAVTDDEPDEELERARSAGGGTGGSSAAMAALEERVAGVENALEELRESLRLLRRELGAG